MSTFTTLGSLYSDIVDVWPENRPQRLCHLVFGSPNITGHFIVRCASHKGLETAPFFPLARGELSLWTRLGSWFCSDFGMFWNVWPNFWAGFLNCLFVEFLVCFIVLDSFYVILLLWIGRLVTSYQSYILYIHIYNIPISDYCLKYYIPYMVCKLQVNVHLASLTASKTDHSHSCCWGDAKRTRLEGSHGEVPGVFLCVLWFWAMWVRHPNGLKWDLMIWPRTTEPTKPGNNNPSSQLFSFSGRPAAHL